MADPKKLKSKNVNDYIKNADEQALRESNKPLIYGFTGLVIAGIAIAAFSFMGTGKEPEKSYEELAASKSEQVTVTETKEEDDKGGMLSGLFDRNKKKSNKIPSDAPIYTTPPSDEIIGADPLNGEVQLGDYIFTLPCTLTAFTDAGFEVVGWGPQNSKQTFSLDDVIKKDRGAEILVRYDEHTVYALYLYNKEDAAIINSTVIMALQRTDAAYFDPLAKPMFAAGGVHVGTTVADANAYYGQFDNYRANGYGFHILNGPIQFDNVPNNYITLSSYSNDGEIVGVCVCKNY